MMLEVKFVLTGSLAGQTIELGSLPYRFQNGEMILRAPEKDMAMHAQFLERNWQVAQEVNWHGERNSETNQPDAVSGESQPEGGGIGPGIEENGVLIFGEDTDRPASSIPARNGSTAELARNAGKTKKR